MLFIGLQVNNMTGKSKKHMKSNIIMDYGADQLGTGPIPTKPDI